MKTVLESVGAEAEDEKIEKLIADLEGKNVEELIKEGLEKLVSIPAAGAAAAAPAAAAAASEVMTTTGKQIIFTQFPLNSNGMGCLLKTWNMEGAGRGITES